MEHSPNIYNTEQSSDKNTLIRASGLQSYLPRKKAAFLSIAGFYKLRTWHSGFLRHIGFYRNRPEKIDVTEHASEILLGLSELLKLVVGACFFLPPITPGRSHHLANGYEWFRTLLSVDRLHMHLHDLVSEIDPMLVRTKSTCPLCAMLDAYHLVIHSGISQTWGHPMTWCSMATAQRGGVFLTGIFRSVMRQSDDLELDSMDFARLERCYELLVHLLYLVQSGTQHKITGSVSVGLHQFQRELEQSLDSEGREPGTFALMGFGGNNLMRLRDLRSPAVMEEVMEKSRILVQQSAETINNDYSSHDNSQHAPDGIIANGETHIHQHGSKSSHSDKKSSQTQTGSRPPNQKIKATVRKILEDNPDGLDGAAIFSHLQRRKTNIPNGIENEDDIRSYISKFISALRKDMEFEGLTITNRPYKIVPLEREEGDLRQKI